MEETTNSEHNHVEFIEDLQNKTGYVFLTNDVARDPLYLARWCVAQAFKGNLNRIIDIREDENAKPRVKSRGLKSFLRARALETLEVQGGLPPEERTCFVWLSKTYDDNGYPQAKTFNVQRNRFKRLARSLAKQNNVSYKLSKKELAKALGLTLEKARAGDFTTKETSDDNG